jgi:superfamily II DNA or RNA helicase
MIDPRTKWQDEVLQSYIASDQKDFLITACPASGKTKAALKLAKYRWDAGQIKRIIVIGPTCRVRKQWNEAAAEMGLDLTAVHNYPGPLPEDVHGAVFTYSRLASQVELYRAIVSRVPTMVILDEVHHAADHEHAAWGKALNYAFEGAAFRVSLSGTPFRTDRVQIPFMKYDTNGIAVPDYSLTYGDAVADGICRPVLFEVMNGSGEWLRGTDRHTATTEDVTDDQRSGLLTALYSPHGVWIKSIFRAADEELERQREEKPDAGGLVVAQDIKTAKAYQKLLSAIAGEPVALVVSEKDDTLAAGNDEIIDAFRGGRSKWVVAVAMIAEGVDIPRLSVLVFASRTLTEMWFRQVIGRVVRMGAAPAITATVFIPAIAQLVRYAETIEQEAAGGEARNIERLGRDFEAESREVPDIPIAIGSSEAERGHVIAAGVSYGSAELQEARELASQVGGSLLTVHDKDLAAMMRLIKGREATETTIKRVEFKSPHSVPTTGDQYRAALRNQVNNMVKVYIGLTNRDWEDVYSWLNKAAGDKQPAASVDSLKLRIDLMKQAFVDLGRPWS